MLYPIFDEGHMASSGAHVARVELSAEAIRRWRSPPRLTREVHRRLADDGEVAGLRSLMLLTGARRPARARADGTLVPLAAQDRWLWDRAKIAGGAALVEESAGEQARRPVSASGRDRRCPRQGAKRAEDRLGSEIVAVCEVLEGVSPGPMVTLNRPVGVAMSMVAAVRAHLLEMAGDEAGGRGVRARRSPHHRHA